MTAVNMIQFERDVLIYSDTAMYDPMGTMMGHLQKTHVLLPQKALVAARGPVRTTGLYRMHAGHRQDFDEIVRNMADDLRDAVRLGYSLGDPSCVTIDVAGWSQLAGEYQLYEMWAIGPSPEDLDTDSLALHRYGSIFTVPHISASKLAGGGVLDENGAFRVDDLDANMIRMMELQRSTSYRIGPTTQHRGCIVGGAIQKTHLNSDGAWTSIIYQWPDEIGKAVGAGSADREEFYYPSELQSAG